MIRFIIGIITLAAVVYAGNRSLPAGGASLPPLGAFFSPQTGFWKNGQVDDQDELTLSSLEHESAVLIDERGVPHIRAKNDADAARIQGYLHAKNRLFQMDMSTRFTAGRLSELLGENMLNIDRLMRRRGLGYAAEQTLETWQDYPTTQAIMNAYAQGVNDYISSLTPRDFPIEYKLINATPEPWTPLKTALMSKSMAYDLCFRNEDAEATKSRTFLGEALYNELLPFRNKKEDPIIPKNTDWNITIDNLIETGDIIEHIYPPNHKSSTQDLLPPAQNGSNNWAVAPKKTKNGHAILCNDPHLQLRLPSIWYETQITTDATNTYGVSIPGIPGVIIGFNEHIAWGVTNVAIDVLDWYGIQWTDKSQQAYEIDGKIKSATPRVETILIKGQSPLTDTVWYTDWGPLTYGHDTSHYLHDYAMHWIGHRAPTTDESSTFFQLNRAKNLADYLQAASSFVSPAQNMVFADQKGDIALRVSGAFPVRDGNSGAFLLDGSHSYNAWKGLVSPNENPMAVNPPRGFVSSANQISTDSTYPHAYYGHFDEYRGRILNEKLAAMENITVDDMKRLQLDSESILARDGMELFKTLLPTDANLSDQETKYFHQLTTWNHQFEADKIEPALFMDWIERFHQKTWDEFYTLPTEVKIPEYWRTIELGISSPDYAYFDSKETGKKETANDIALITFQQAVEALDTLLKDDANYNWSTHNASRVNHLMNLEAFSSDVHPISGCRKCLNAVQETHGPSWRMVVELSDPVQAWGVYPGGQSGHPGAKHYNDFLPTWVEGEYYPLNLYSRAEDLSRQAGNYIKIRRK